MTELIELPQIVSARDPRAQARAEKLFLALTVRVVPLQPEEAELAKLFTDAWRYVKFAVANQSWMTANDLGVDLGRVRAAAVDDYPRAADLPGPGFTAGHCLLNDTMQLAAFSSKDFLLAHWAMLVNEGCRVRRGALRGSLRPLGDDRGNRGNGFQGRQRRPEGQPRIQAAQGPGPAGRGHALLRFLPSGREVREHRGTPGACRPRHRGRAPPDVLRLVTDRPVVDIWGITGQAPLV